MILGPRDAQLDLQSSVNKTASFNSASIDLGAGFAPATPRPMQANLRVSAIDVSSGDETYSLKVQDSSDNVTFTDRSEARAITATGVDAFGCGILNRYVRLVLTVAGTTPSITYETWLSPR